MKIISDCIQDMPVSNLGWDTNYPDVFSAFSSVLPTKCRDIASD